jgi:hypothetical protein
MMMARVFALLRAAAERQGPDEFVPTRDEARSPRSNWVHRHLPCNQGRPRETPALTTYLNQITPKYPSVSFGPAVK